MFLFFFGALAATRGRLIPAGPLLRFCFGFCVSLEHPRPREVDLLLCETPRGSERGPQLTPRPGAPQLVKSTCGIVSLDGNMRTLKLLNENVAALVEERNAVSDLL